VPATDLLVDDHELVLVTPYVESLSLGEVLDRAKRARIGVPAPVAVRIVVDALSGLHAAHEARDAEGRRLGIVHGDVSPRNLIVGTDGFTRIVDFGASRSGRPTHSTGVLEGSLPYMAPEQMMGRALDRRADVYAAGVVLHEALSGRSPFPVGDVADTVLSVVVGLGAQPSSRTSGIPPQIARVIAGAVHRSPEARFSTAERFADSLARACPPARRREVAALVERAGSRLLETRRERLRRADHASA
jgi:serine/threonine protein kinase